MAAKKVGVLVKEARTAAGLTQEKLAKAAGEGLTASDIGKCERGEADLTAAQLKKIAVACGVTQKSLVEAPKNLSAAAAKKAAAAAKTTAKKTESKTTAAKTAAAKKTESKTTASKTTAKKTESKTTAKTAAAKKTEPAVPASANISMKVTTTEQKLIKAYRGSTSDRKKASLKLLNGDYGDTVDKLLSVTNGSIGTASSSSSSSDSPDLLGDLLGNVLGGLLGGK